MMDKMKVVLRPKCVEVSKDALEVLPLVLEIDPWVYHNGWRVRWGLEGIEDLEPVRITGIYDEDTSLEIFFEYDAVPNLRIQGYVVVKDDRAIGGTVEYRETWENKGKLIASYVI